MRIKPRLTKYARRNRADPTKSESIIWADLRGQQLGYKFKRQQPIGPYIVDFVCYSKKLIVELDGWTHGLAQNFDRDDARQVWLEYRGFTVLRFTDEEVMEDREAVGDAIFATLELL
ncbi:MAG: endonuclease domain-containing protein [bacterium]|nr:endonuclease domain-containing protein [bacterium]